MKKKHVFNLVACIALLIGICGCGTTPRSRFYQLQPRVAKDLNLSPVPEGKRYSITMQPTRLSSYLERPQIVIKEDDGSFTVLELHRWAGELEEDIYFVLVADIASDAIKQDIEVKPWPGSSADLKIGTEIYRLDCGRSGSCQLAARWTLSGKNYKPKSYIKQYKKTAGGQEYVDKVKTMNELLHMLAVDITKSLPEDIKK